MLELKLESADYNTKLADSSADFVVDARLPILKMVNIYLLFMSADWNRLTANSPSGYWPGPATQCDEVGILILILMLLEASQTIAGVSSNCSNMANQLVTI